MTTSPQKTKMIRLSIIALLAITFCILLAHYTQPHLNTTTTKIATSTNTETSSPFVSPMSNARARITKKHLGTYVTPTDSPVSPERFTGYHTGVDFETFLSEQTTDVPIYAICSGKVLIDQFGKGYGGIFVTSCTLNEEPITIVYGHLRLTSIQKKVGDTVTAGEQIAVLGTGYSSETDGERKHLHLGIHTGAIPDTRGYIANKADLANWITIESYLQ